MSADGLLAGLEKVDPVLCFDAVQTKFDSHSDAGNQNPPRMENVDITVDGGSDCTDPNRLCVQRTSREQIMEPVLITC